MRTGLMIDPSGLRWCCTLKQLQFCPFSACYLVNKELVSEIATQDLCVVYTITVKQEIFVNFVNRVKVQKLVFAKGFFMRILIGGRPKCPNIGTCKRRKL